MMVLVDDVFQSLWGLEYFYSGMFNNFNEDEDNGELNGPVSVCNWDIYPCGIAPTHLGSNMVCDSQWYWSTTHPMLKI